MSVTTPEAIQEFFSREDGSYAFARWGRPIAPIVFGVADETLATVKGALEAVVTLAGHQIAETDPELGSNLMFFFFRDWSELLEVPDLDRLIPGLSALVAKLDAAEANQYRVFRFEKDGAIRAAFVFLKMESELQKLPAETLALGQAVQVILMWGDRAFAASSPLAKLPETGATILRPDVAGIIAAAYDRMMPPSAVDPSHAYRIFARLQG